VGSSLPEASFQPFFNTYGQLFSIFLLGSLNPRILEFCIIANEFGDDPFITESWTMKADTFFTPEERERIRQTTKQVESRTIGEVVVMVVDQGDRYREAEILGGVLLSSLLALLLTILFFHGSFWSFVPIGFLGFFIFNGLVAKISWLKRGFLSPKRTEEAVQKRALLAFYEKGLYKTRLNTGVLFFLALLERKVWVLADRGIYEKIQQEKLNYFALKVSQGIRQDRACEALCQAIQEMGDLLAGHFPITANDVDELPDEVLTD
jgi:putative membrane protein